jgi:hypothetical protein
VSTLRASQSLRHACARTQDRTDSDGFEHGRVQVTAGPTGQDHRAIMPWAHEDGPMQCAQRRAAGAGIREAPQMSDCCQNCCHGRSQLLMRGDRPGRSAQHVATAGRFWTFCPRRRIKRLGVRVRPSATSERAIEAPGTWQVCVRMP